MYKLLDHKHVLVGNTRLVCNLRDYYYQYDLHKTGDDIFPYFSGFAMRKNLNAVIKTKLTKM